MTPIHQKRRVEQKESGKPMYRGRLSRKQPNVFNISLSRADSVFVDEQIARLGFYGPSEFFQKLLSEARGAKLPIVTRER